MKDVKENPVLSALVGVSVLLGGSGLWWNVDGVKAAENRLTKIEVKLDQLASDKLTLAKYWKLHTWAKDEINALRHANNMGPATWPDL